MSYDENREMVLVFMVDKAFCNREYAETWFENERLSAFGMETPEHLVRSGQVDALMDYLETATLEDVFHPDGGPEEDDYTVIVRGESLGMNQPDKNG